MYKLRDAFKWLKQNNPYYQNVEWSETHEREWLDEGVSVGATRGEGMSEGLGLQVTGDVIRMWMRESLLQHGCGDGGFAIGRRLLKLLELEPGDDAEPVEDVDPWNVVRSKISSAMGSNSLRAAAALPDFLIPVFFCI